MFNCSKLKSVKPYIGEFTVFIIVNIANLNELSIVISEKVKSEVSKNKEKINIMILKKYLLTSLLPYVESENR
jgi:hypothetical protein|tara:strand:+ start:116 stop:334 length:219 start_codon:yes stop_codon:yes gene_type:complete